MKRVNNYNVEKFEWCSSNLIILCVISRTTPFSITLIMQIMQVFNIANYSIMQKLIKNAEADFFAPTIYKAASGCRGETS